MQGGAPLDSRVANYVLKTLKSKLPEESIKQALTDRELEILSLMAKGLVKKEIAETLDISTSTVVTHVSHIYEKLEASNAPSAIHKAHRLGLFPKKKN